MLINLISWTLAVIGHVGVWCVAFNRTHATALSRRYRKFGEKLIVLMVLLPVICVAWTLIRTQDYSLWGTGLYSTSVLLFGYCLGCLAISTYFVAGWVRRRLFQTASRHVVGRRRERVNLQTHLQMKLTQGTLPNLLAWVPGNQATQLAIEHRELQFERLPAAWSGLKVVQLSDLHFTGQIRMEYFQEIVRRVNQFQPDLVLITGDLIDEPACLDWIEPVLGSLKARGGVYFVRGNHDLRIKDREDYLTRLQNAGLEFVGGQWKVLDLDGAKLGLAGNEIPWFAGAEDLPHQPPQDVDFKILLSHSPDQLTWAEPYQFDWMLAGHTHGGQIQFPVIGPIVAPSKYGVRFASGEFDLGSTFMYVSRGVSGDEAIRINCPPEVGFFTLNPKS